MKKKVERLSISEMINVSDAIQGIFEYIGCIIS